MHILLVKRIGIQATRTFKVAKTNEQNMNAFKHNFQMGEHWNASKTIMVVTCQWFAPKVKKCML